MIAENEGKLSCSYTGKICYSERDAGTLLNRCKTSRGRRGRKNKTPKRKYFCNYCNSWHLTSMSYFKGK